MQASGILFALVLFCLSLLPFSLSLSALLSLQPASMQTGGQAMPLCSACCERWVTEPDNTTNCSIFEEIKHSVCLKFHYLFAFFPPPQINLALYAKQWSSSRVESNKIRLPESFKSVALLYSCTLWNKINVLYVLTSVLSYILKTHSLWSTHFIGFALETGWSVVMDQVISNTKL